MIYVLLDKNGHFIPAIAVFTFLDKAQNAWQVCAERYFFLLNGCEFLQKIRVGI